MVKVLFIVQIFPVGSDDFILFAPRYWNSFVHSLISLGKMQRIVCSCSHSHSTKFGSTWYQLLLGGQRKHGFKTCLRHLHMTGAAGIEPQGAVH